MNEEYAAKHRKTERVEMGGEECREKKSSSSKKKKQEKHNKY